MSEPFTGEIRLFGGNFAPVGWALCDGQLLAVSSYDALFSLLGTTYGGDGRTTFALPDLRGRVPIHQGTGSGLTDRKLGAQGGSETVALQANELPAHTHTMQASTSPANSADPTGSVLAEASADIYVAETPGQAMASSISDAGSSQPHDNVMPFGTANYIIALYGIYPSRT
jgi:microcystin-dependent protein